MHIWSVTFGALSNISYAQLGGAMMGMPLLDPIAALLVSGMIVKAGMENLYQRYSIDARPGPSKIPPFFD
jgi:divalent metal cation (Fe/Co/Zn/Cd) transporter